MSWIISWLTTQLRYHWRIDMLRQHISCKKYLVHNLHYNMCEGSFIIPYFCYSLIYLLWRNIYVGSHLFWNFYFECILGSWGLYMRYSMPCIIERNTVSAQWFTYPLIHMVSISMTSLSFYLEPVMIRLDTLPSIFQLVVTSSSLMT